MSEKPASDSADFEAEEPGVKRGFLQRTDTGRWSIGPRYELTSGEGFEVNLDRQWVRVRMEHDGTAYYTIPGVVLFEGLEARQRWRQ